MRLRRKAGTKLALQQMDELVVLQPKEWRGRWHERFGNRHPIHVELGMGKGRFINEMSVRHPEWNFIGIDRYDELLRRASEKVVESQSELELFKESHNKPNNLILVLGNIETIEEMFARGEIERIYLNFSDPWPKTRHAERRLTHRNFVTKYIELLNSRGEIHFKTDSRSLFEFSLNTFAEMGLMMRNISLDLHGNGLTPNHVMTEYEAKFHEQGMPIYRVEVIVGDEALMR
jgi:tRNA (guanine-N7-)-methyltransferase